MLDHAVAVDEVELAVGEGKSFSRVGDHQSAAVTRSFGEVDARDIEVRRLPQQAGAAASDIEDSRRPLDPRGYEERRVATASGPSGERLGDPGKRSAGVVVYAWARHDRERSVTPSG